MVNEVQIPSENIILFGRSIGSGPATYLAGNRNPGLLILMSPYTSIKDVVKHVAGKWATYLIAERFRNIDEITKAKCPCFFIHGDKDRLIPVSHSKDLYANCKSLAAMNLSQEMTHNDYSLHNDVIKPLKKFLNKIEYMDGNTKNTIIFPDYVKKIPLKKYRRMEGSGSLIGLFKNDENNVELEKKISI